AIRTGYRTDTVKENNALAGFSTGIGIQAFGQEFAYAWVPMGDLGNTNYFSLLIRLGEANRAGRNLINFQSIKQHHAKGEEINSDYEQLMQILSDSDSHVAQNIPANPGSG